MTDALAHSQLRRPGGQTVRPVSKNCLHVHISAIECSDIEVGCRMFPPAKVPTKRHSRPRRNRYVFPQMDLGMLDACVPDRDSVCCSCRESHVRRHLRFRRQLLRCRQYLLCHKRGTTPIALSPIATLFRGQVLKRTYMRGARGKRHGATDASVSEGRDRLCIWWSLGDTTPGDTPRHHSRCTAAGRPLSQSAWRQGRSQRALYSGGRG